ncbi:hypothetical protein LEN26_004393 [Aphanomyces euteiches]|nr:hypothetical protein AeMF1_007995 [Aphanomyces euteiches]KAH9148822.1 hypothetical protein LEN26_004393 [Aphanomyces euteiches]
MRFVTPLLLATSAVVAFQQLGQESPGIMVHDQGPLAIQDLLNLQQDTAPSRQLAAAGGHSIPVHGKPVHGSLAAQMRSGKWARAPAPTTWKSASRVIRKRRRKGNSTPQSQTI